MVHETDFGKDVKDELTKLQVQLHTKKKELKARARGEKKATEKQTT